MARVPTVEGPQIQERALAGPMDAGRAPAQAFDNSGLAQGLAAATNQISDAAARIQQRRDRQMAYEVETAIKTEFNDWDAEQRRSLRGGAAAEYPNMVEAWWEDAKKRHLDNLPTSARRAVMPSLSTSRLQSVSGASNYAANEVERAADEAYNASQIVEIERASLSGDPAVALASRDLIRRRVYEQAAVKGWEAERREVEELKWMSQLHSHMVGKLLDADASVARQYYERHIDEISVTQRPGLEKTLEDAETTQQARGLVDGLSGLPFDEVMERIRSEPNDRVREKARQFARNDESDRKLGVTNSQKAAHDEIWQQIANGAGFEQLSPSTLARMSGSDRQSVTDYFRREAAAKEAAARGEDIKTDPNVAAYLDSLIASNPAAFVALGDLRQSPFGNGLSDTDYVKYNRQQQALNNPDRLQTHQQVLSTFFSANGMEGKRQAEARGQLTGAYYDAVDQFVQHNKREPDHVESQKILNGLVAQGIVQRTNMLGWLPFLSQRRSGPLYAIEDPALRQEAIRNVIVPDAARARIVHSLRAQGLQEPSEEAIRELYLQQIWLAPSID